MLKFTIHKTIKRINNINMKKILFLILIILSLTCSCTVKKEQAKFEVINKKTEITQNYEVDYPSVDEKIDEALLCEVKQTCEKIQTKYNTLPTIQYESYINQDIVSYKFIYDYFQDTIIKTYNYDLKEKREIKFSSQNIIKDLNKRLKDKYYFVNDDKDFMNFFIRDETLVIYLSPYLTSNRIAEVIIPLKDEYLNGEKEESKQEKKLIAITFDDGPSSKTKEIVDLLEKLKIKATFFVLGCNVKNHQEELKYINQFNHEIGNHSYSHPNFKKLSLQEGLNEINQTQEIVFETIKRYPRLFRFPYGSVNKEVLRTTRLPTILWSADSLDWKCYDTLAIVNNIKKEAKENGILLFHDFKYYNKVAIETIVNDLKKDGYTFVTISELLNFKSNEEMVQGTIIYSKNSIS